MHIICPIPRHTKHTNDKYHNDSVHLHKESKISVMAMAEFELPPYTLARDY